MSGGEFGVRYLRTQPNGLHVGARTRGSLSHLVAKALPNGWMMEMPNEIVVAPDGRDCAAVGIPPRIALPVYDGDDSLASHRQAIAMIVDRIRRCIAATEGAPCW